MGGHGAGRGVADWKFGLIRLTYVLIGRRSAFGCQHLTMEEFT